LASIFEQGLKQSERTHMSACLPNNFASEHVPNFKSDQQVKKFSGPGPKKESEKAKEILTPDNAIR